MIFYDKNFNQTAEFFGTDLNIGLEEKKINERQKQFGLNLIKEKKNRAYLRNFYRSLMIL